MNNECEASVRDDAAVHHTDEAVALAATLREIGVARFIGRINSGVIDSTEGYKALERYAVEVEDRPLLSRLSHLLMGRQDTFGRSRGGY
jgi:hypothetical protein